MLRLGWFSSGREGSAELLTSVVDWLEKKRVDASIAFVFSNWERREEPDHAHSRDREALFEAVDAHRIPLVALSWKRFRDGRSTGTKEEWKKDYGRQLRSLVVEHRFDIGILAGYTLTLDEETMDLFPFFSLDCSPSGEAACGLEEGILRAITLRSEAFVCSMNQARPEWDVSLPVAESKFPTRTPELQTLWRDYELWSADRASDLLPKADIERTALFERLRRDAKRRQGALLGMVVQMFATSKLEIRKGKVYEGANLLSRPYDLTHAVEGAIAAGEF